MTAAEKLEREMEDEIPFIWLEIEAYNALIESNKYPELRGDIQAVLDSVIVRAENNRFVVHSLQNVASYRQRVNDEAEAKDRALNAKFAAEMKARIYPEKSETTDKKRSNLPAKRPAKQSAKRENIARRTPETPVTQVTQVTRNQHFTLRAMKRVSRPQ